MIKCCMGKQALVREEILQTHFHIKRFYDDHLFVYFQTFIIENPHPVLGSAALVLTFVQPLIAMIRYHYKIEAISLHIFLCTGPIQSQELDGSSIGLTGSSVTLLMS